MCGIFGLISLSGKVDKSELIALAMHARQRGVDASGLVLLEGDQMRIVRADAGIHKLTSKVKFGNPNMVLGHSRLVTNGFTDNQPIYRDGLVVLHNGIITNCDDLWTEGRKRRLQIDTEIIPVILSEVLKTGATIGEAVEKLLEETEGVISTAIYEIETGRLLLLSNNGSLYAGEKNGQIGFSSEEWPLISKDFKNIRNIKGYEVIETGRKVAAPIETAVLQRQRTNLVPGYIRTVPEENMLVHEVPNLKRCTKCILPETMPYIEFDHEGVCNYCNNYELRNVPKPISSLIELVKPYRRDDHVDCIVPFSGGRDSCMALHLIVKELGMKPIAYTYDWGMVTDLGRRNISRMCAELGVENIIIAADIEKKRSYIRKNLEAWLKKPHLGMISLLTAGDKHFFRYIEQIKKQTGVSLNIWGINPLEVTHFKAGFLGVPPAFHEKHVYNNGLAKQLSYQKKRFAEYLRNPGYLNASMFDTLSGEYWRSIHKKTDYFHMFDYYTWDEKEIDGVLAEYNWELAIDTTTTWRIGDGTAAFYNYIYYTVAGFTEHDTFRSNQIREGQMDREEALRLVNIENQPRYPNIKWYLDAVGVDYEKAIKAVNAIPRLY
ncbi:glucosamine 6-phosphate synthetase [Marivivens sp. LCG002]|uniref:glucosamine 6-phosphate synthetase n=1 Tax=Marivivens sp. LCG002 TaxID=3051171 RepID=UPI0025560C36|nr:glucosamine 6-phosphate synthetase [Marivivens sp. LCG002]WIV51420.1 glucosamine 6-phosphate synthetase [Marivivens sp. LCG002]